MKPEWDATLPAEKTLSLRKVSIKIRRRSLRQRGKPAKERLVCYAFADKADFDRFKPAIGAHSNNGAELEGKVKASVEALSPGRFARTVVDYEIRPKPKSP